MIEIDHKFKCRKKKGIEQRKGKKKSPQWKAW